MKTAFELAWKALAVTAAALIGNMLINILVFSWLGDVWGWEDRPALSALLRDEMTPSVDSVVPIRRPSNDHTTFFSHGSDYRNADRL